MESVFGEKGTVLVPSGCGTHHPINYVEFLLELSRGSNLAAEKHLEEILTLQVAVRPHLVMIQDLPPEFCQLS